MINIISIILLSFISFSQEVKKIKADIFDLKDLSKVEFKLEMEQTFKDGFVHIDSKFTKNDLTFLQEVAKINSKTGDFLEYKITNNQTNESGKVVIENDKIKIDYVDNNNKSITKSFAKLPNIVSPANFEQWISRFYLANKSLV